MCVLNLSIKCLSKTPKLFLLIGKFFKCFLTFCNLNYFIYVVLKLFQYKEESNIVNEYLKTVQNICTSYFNVSKENNHFSRLS